MSSAFHAVVRGPSLTGLGKRPVLHPSHHALLLMGTNFKTWGKRRKPVAGIDVFIVMLLCWTLKNKKAHLWTVKYKGALGSLTEHEAQGPH